LARYRMLTLERQRQLRQERVALLEADLFRAEMQLAEAQSGEERAAVQADISAFSARLRVHYAVLDGDQKSSTVDPVGDHE